MCFFRSTPGRSSMSWTKRKPCLPEADQNVHSNGVYLGQLRVTVRGQSVSIPSRMGSSQMPGFEASHHAKKRIIRTTVGIQRFAARRDACEMYEAASAYAVS